MNHMPRLHPDDLQVIINGTVAAIEPKIVEAIRAKIPIESITAFPLEEAAKMIGIHKNTLTRQIKNGDFPAAKLGGKYFIAYDVIHKKLHP